MSDASKLFKKKQVIIENQSFVVSIPKRKVSSEEASVKDSEDEDLLDADDPVERALRDRHHLLSDADQEAKEIISGAKKTAEEIILGAYDKSEEIRRTAREEGYASGLQTAEEEYRRRLEESEGELLEIKRELLKERETLLLRSEHEMIALVLNTLERMVSIRRDTDEDLVMNLVQKSISGLTHINHLVVRISEFDRDQSERIKSKLMLGAERIDTVEVKIDETLEKGSCVVETDRGSINAGLDLQLERVKRAFRSLIEERNA